MRVKLARLQPKFTHNCCRRPVVLLLSPPLWAHQQEKKQPVRILLLLLLLPLPPPAVMFVFMFGLGFNFWLFGIVKILLPALIWKWMLSEKTGAAVQEHSIPFSSHIHSVKSRNAADQNLSPASDTRVCFFFCLFICFLNLAGLNMV